MPFYNLINLGSPDCGNQLGDGICNEAYNSPECNYDGGDCDESRSTTANSGGIYSGCAGDFSQIANGECNEQNNNPECEYDGRDCCEDYSEYDWIVDWWIGDGNCEDCKIPRILDFLESLESLRK